MRMNEATGWEHSREKAQEEDVGRWFYRYLRTLCLFAAGVPWLVFRFQQPIRLAGCEELTTIHEATRTNTKKNVSIRVISLASWIAFPFHLFFNSLLGVAKLSKKRFVRLPGAPRRADYSSPQRIRHVLQPCTRVVRQIGSTRRLPASRVPDRR